MKRNIRRCPRGHRHSFRTFGVFQALLVLALILPWSLRTAFAEEPLDRQITIDISANTPLEDALIEWGTKVGMTVMINTKTVSQCYTRHVSGTLTARRALNLLLQDSHLSYTQNEERIHIVPTSSLTRGDFKDVR